MKKIIIVTSVLCLILCGCSKKTEAVSDTEKQLSEIADKLEAIAEVLDESGSGSDSEDAVVFEDDFSEDDFIDDNASSDDQTPTTSKKQTTKSQASKTAHAVPATVQEIVKYFSDSANAVKKDKPGFTIVETPTVGEVKLNGGPFSIVNAIKSAAMQLVKPSEKSAKKGEDHSVFPVEGELWACKLDASFVKKAECKKSGNYYVISIYLKDETLSSLPKKHEDCNTGKVINVLTDEQISDILDSIPLLKVKKFSPVYTGCYVTCKINSTTGKMAEATYFMNNIVNIQANSSINASVDFAIKQEIKINY